MFSPNTSRSSLGQEQVADALLTSLSSSRMHLKHFLLNPRLWLATTVLLAGSIQCTGPLLVEPMQTFETCEELSGFVEERILHPRATGSEGSAILTGCAESALMSVADGAGYSEEAPPVDFTTTNVQIDEVDEADFVKNNGEVLYVLKQGTLFVVDTWPAEDATLLFEEDLGTHAQNLFLDDDLLVVIGADSSDRDGARFFSEGQVELRLYDVSVPENPVLTRHLRLDGVYTDARRVGDELMLVTTRWLVDAGSLSRGLYTDDENRAKLSEEPIEDRFPTLSEVDVNTGVVQASQPLNSCNNMYAPDRTDGQSLTTITRIHLRDDEVNVKSTGVVAPWSEIYANDKAIYLAAIETTDGGPFTPPVFTTRFHKLRAFQGEGAAEYVGTAVVNGQLLSRYSMDEYDGNLRVVLSSQTTTDESNPNNFLVIFEENEIGLTETGRIDDIGNGEFVQAVRFRGERGFVVTYPVNNVGIPNSGFSIPPSDVIDPLFTLDLSDPFDPQKRGELEVGGYSTYLHPVDENTLLTVGVNTDSDNQFRGVSLILFDVTDLDAPFVLHRTDFGDETTGSLALSKPYAFTYFRSQELLSVPLDGEEFGDLLVFDVDKETGIREVGRLTGTTEVTRDDWEVVRCGGFERSIMAATADDQVFIYGVAPGGVDIAALERDDGGEPESVRSVTSVSFSGGNCF
ncbi:MAG: hypothetical protein GY822_08035 [Deltaproteobacteria bacterium]|nr:hypothetical protein [Deltaproteobacteria bacterium]